MVALVPLPLAVQTRANYDKAMQSWGDDSDGINALKMGRNVFSPKFDMQSENLALREAHSRLRAGRVG